MPVGPILRKLASIAGYTVLRGDLRASARHAAGGPALPERLLKNARVKESRASVLTHLPRGGTVVEVGVAYGDFSQVLLDELRPDRFIAIDTFAFSAGHEPWGRTSLKDGNTTHLAYYSSRFRREIDAGRMEVRQGLSWEMVARLPDESVDYMYVDADHSYASVAKDVRALAGKMKRAGIIQFNDYTVFDPGGLVPYGVPRAVNEFMIEHDYEMLYLCLDPRGYYDVVVRKASS